MNRTELIFERPDSLAATAPPERQGRRRDQVRLLVSDSRGHQHRRFTALAEVLQTGDVLVVNESATIPASLSARGRIGTFILNLSTNYGRGLWVAEPRRSPSEPGPLPLQPGERVQLGGVYGRMVAPYPGLKRLWFVRVAGELNEGLYHWGSPIRYGYAGTFPLADYQTIFAKFPGSAEMPSAGRPFSRTVLETLQKKGILTAGLVLHTGVSSLEVETENIASQPLYAEPFHVPARTAAMVNRAHETGHKVIAVGTTVVRALESAWDGEKVRERRGFTRLYIHPGRELKVIDGLVTGLHDPVTSHLAMLYSLAGKALIQEAYQAAIRKGYLWHEFGDSHLILPKKPAE